MDAAAQCMLTDIKKLVIRNQLVIGDGIYTGEAFVSDPRGSQFSFPSRKLSPNSSIWAVILTEQVRPGLFVTAEKGGGSAGIAPVPV